MFFVCVVFFYMNSFIEKGPNEKLTFMKKHTGTYIKANIDPFKMRLICKLK